MSRPVSYTAIHHTLRTRFSPASEHTCPCGSPAAEWAYRYTGDPELRDANGNNPHSTNPADYAAMCRACHIAFDLEHDQPRAEAMLIKLSQNSGVIAERRRIDPMFAANNLLNASLGGQAVALMRRRCLECGHVSTPGGLGNHLKFNGHEGWENVDD